ncbi:hypothetical protein PHLCEN_2v852 [Hermanssonia centrifuga]|uniref:Uncharacterized protein n=1 Tax=Hermanssonia centrifuga TaxID=98765 RepID=A0A2R6S4T2_9APHY|nr:hypothetical protein PHLCEN_2v852 [Hermanssonia centrifuga]
MPPQARKNSRGRRRLREYIRSERWQLERQLLPIIGGEALQKTLLKRSGLTCTHMNV